MSVYVDRIRDYGDAVKGAAARWGSRWSHLIADTEDELHAFAARIGMKRAWAQYPGTVRSHYDLVPSRRALAIKAGAIEITNRELVEIRRRQREASSADGSQTPRTATHD